MPPYRVLPDFLAAADVAALLAYAEAHEADFEPTWVGGPKGRRRDPETRRSLALHDGLHAFRPLLASLIYDRAAALMASVGMPPMETSRFELQLVAHGDGAFYKRHIDTRTGGGVHEIRVLSGVYYFHRQPKAFAGGALRLCSFARNPQFIDIEPTHNTLLIFPSWAPHEVMPVSCPSGAFMDSRFAINAWIHKPVAGGAPQSEPTKA